MPHLPVRSRLARLFSANARRFAVNALLLIAVNLFMRTVGVAFNVYLSRRAGGEVMGLYSLLFGVYGLALTLGCAGINLGTTRMVADVMGQFCPPEPISRPDTAADAACRLAIRAVLRRCLTYSAFCGTGAGILLFLGAPLIGAHWLGDARTILSLRVLALTLPPVAVSSALGGYFTAVRRIGKNAAVGILGQFLRVGFCAYLLTLWLPEGVEMTCLALVLGGAMSEFCGFLFNLAAFLYDRRRYLLSRSSAACDTDATEGATGKLLGITLPVTLAATARSGLLTLQHALIPKGLKASGASWEEALASYGVVHSVVLPVVLFPSAFINSYSGLLVPEVAESWARGDRERVSRLSGRIMTPALIFSFGVAGIMASFGLEIGEIICGSREAGRYIRILAPLIPIMYVDSSVDAFLKGMGEQVYSMNVNIIDALCSVILVWLLLPRMGLGGYIVAIYATETLNTTLSLCRMLRLSGMKVRLWRQVAAPILSVVGATVFCRLAGSGLDVKITGLPTLIMCLAVCAAIYLGLLWLMMGRTASAGSMSDTNA